MHLTLGEYHFTGGAGKRVFSVRAEGRDVLTDYDPLATLKSREVERKSFEVSVEDDALDLDLDLDLVHGTADDPAVSAIEIEPIE